MVIKMRTVQFGAAGVLKLTPAGSKLIAGDTNLGYYGELAGSELIDPSTIPGTVGMTQGVAINPDTTWLKFARAGKILYVAKRGVRRGMTWLHLSSLNIFTGARIITIKGKRYRLRMLTGGVVDDVPGKNASEWNKLMYRVCTENPSGLPNWASIPQAELSKIIGGSYPTGENWTPETLNTASNICMTRGRSSIAASNYLDTGNNTFYDYGLYRPVLEEAGLATFLGEVTPGAFISGTALAAAMGLTQGAAINDTVGWLKIQLDGRTLMVAKNSFRSTIQMNHLIAAGVVDGTKTIVIAGKTYRVRLFHGGAAHYSMIPTVSGFDLAQGYWSEWNRIMYHLSNGTFANASNKMTSEGITVGDIAQFTEAQLALGVAYQGSACWTQTPSNVTQYICRGGLGVSQMTTVAPNLQGTGNGWRPILELVE